MEEATTVEISLCNITRTQEYIFEYLHLLLAPIYAIVALCFTVTFIIMVLRFLLWKKEWSFAKKFREADRKMIAYMLETFFNMLHHREGIRELESDNALVRADLSPSGDNAAVSKGDGVVTISDPAVEISHSTVIDTDEILRSKLAMSILSFYVANISSLALVVFWDVFILKEIRGCNDEFDSFYKNGTFIDRYCSCLSFEDQESAVSYEIALEFPTAIAEVAGILFLGFNGFAFLMFLKLLVADGIALQFVRVIVYILLAILECMVVFGIISAFLARSILLEKNDSRNVVIEHSLISLAMIVGIATPWAMLLWASRKVIRRKKVISSKSEAS